MRRPRTQRRPGFSITELLVVIAILGLFVALLFPIIGALSGGTRLESGLNIVGMSADVARQWVSPSRWDQDSQANPQHEQYNGTAALFCPTNEIRIVVNDAFARDGGGSWMEDSENGPSPLAFNGYEDLDSLDYMLIPRGAGVVGIRRQGATASFIAPPFAIAFNESGQLNYGDVNGLIYYDGNGDNAYTRSSTRPAGYDPSDWTGLTGSSNINPNATTLKRNLPFEAIETVGGVLVYDAEAFKQQTALAAALNNGGSVATTSTTGQWLEENGRVLFFSPLTGAALRDEDP